MRNGTHREYELNRFVLSGDREQVIRSKIKGFFFLKIYPKLKNAYPGQLIRKQYRLFEEKNAYIFNPEFVHLQNDACLLGYFQSEKYFAGYGNTIREAFRFREPLSGKNREIAEKIKSGNAVSVHIRRGDYISNQISAGIYNPVSNDYYGKAIEYIRQRVDNPEFFIFSDEPEQAKKEIDLPQATYIDWNNESDSYIDMQLMSLCRHNIIANSSFSWWGAWLSNPKDGIVIAPAQWLKNPEENIRIRDLIPDRWIKI
jgi:hypothetical protein